jgi:peptidoglycan hydrolase-like protein with peptidoglycan-binding domain
MKIFAGNLGRGAKGLEVVVLQLFLIATNSNAQKIVPDGEYGEQTFQGVKALQVDLNVPLTGSLDETTRQKIAEQFPSLPLANLPSELLGFPERELAANA